MVNQLHYDQRPSFHRAILESEYYYYKEHEKQNRTE